MSASALGVSGKVRLRPGQEKRLLAGHLWVFSNEIHEIEGAPPAGSVVEVYASLGRLLGVAFYNPASLIACRMLSWGPAEIGIDFFRGRLAAALAYREKTCSPETSYRLAFGESDGLPGLVVDRYGACLVLQILSAGMEACLPLIEQALGELLSPKGIYLKNDHRLRSLEGLAQECRVLSGSVPDKLQISEGGLRFSVPVGGGQKTGFYFDQRENRVFLRPYFKGRAVLDLYSYTGAFGINAAKFGAKAVLGLDSSGPAVELARENAAMNAVAELTTFEEGDAEEALRDFAENRQPFKPDMILLDPPSLAPSKKHLPKALRHYVKLNAWALKALPDGGLLATSSCSHHVSREIFIEMLRHAQAKAGRRTRLVSLKGQGADHPALLAMPETEYLHFALLEVI
ncbi:MAG: class I SAM-dependent rRNA methyltransferase [Elusimicrobia bacterium]|nr:class I SAM-dependent rRNA methyltransferase [Elusimicrobiota bacterium]